MEKIKPIEQLADEVEKGDLVRIKLDENDEYSGYFMYDNSFPMTRDGSYFFQSTLKWNQNPSVLKLPEKKLSIAGEEPDPWKERNVIGYEILRRAKQD